MYLGPIKQLGLICRNFTNNSTLVKKQLYISLVYSQLMYCPQIWSPNLAQYIQLLGKVQLRATKYMMNDYSSPYRARLLKLLMLPAMFTLELNNLLFFIKSFKNPSLHFDIAKYVHFNSSGCTRSSSHFKLVHNHTKYTSHNIFWFIFTLKFDDNHYCTYHVLCPCHKCSSTPIIPLFN